MKTKTMNLIIVIILLVTVVAIVSVVAGVDIDKDVIIGTDGSGTVEPCIHKAHNKSGACTTCGELVGHDYSVASGKYSSIGNGKHNTSFYCSGSCGSYEGAVQTCTYSNGVCTDCGYNIGLAQTCTHSKHNEEGMCTTCGTWVDHNEILYYGSNGDNTHTVSYTCADNCGYGGSSGPIGCTFVGGKCVDCGGIACSHTSHNTSGLCTACGYDVRHDYDYDYDQISGDDLYHNYSASCATCNKAISGKGNHYYNGDYTCDKCGYTAVIE